MITYDEHGGFYDHVPPPATIDDDAEFRQLGFRVPTLVIGPTVRRGCAVDTVFEHSSIPATVSRRFGLPELNAGPRPPQSVGVHRSGALDDPQPPPVLPTLAISRRDSPPARRMPAHGPGLASRAARRDRCRHVPRHLDRRADADAIARRVLAWGERLGAVKLVD